jgi:DNA gyrase subunit A
MGKYHPHGDSSIYGALVVLAQDFKMGQPLVDGHGNFGSIEGDGAAAMRYTEARLQKLTQEAFLSDLDKGVVEFVPNFDETEKEPSVLPARIPNLLVNGSEGIAVGMATSIPPHNLGEVIDATIALIRDHSLTNEDLMKYIKGPDFPTGGIVVNEKELAHIYATGTGKIRIRGKVEVEKVPRSDKKRIVITQIPYTMIGAGIGKFLNDVAALADSRIGSDISDISNQSSKEGIRIVLELRKGADEEYIKKLLYKKTRLEDTFGVNMLAVSDGRPETLSLHDILEAHIDFQFEIATKKYRSMLDRELEKKEIQEGLIRAVDVIDLIIEILRGSKDRAMAKDCLVTGNTEGIRFKTKKSKTEASRLRFTQAQATAILEMRLYKLIGLEIDALTAEYEDTLKKIDTYTDILNNYSSMANVIILQLEEYRDSYARERRTRICDEDEVVLEVKKAEAYPCVLLVDRFGYARTVDEAVYEKNKEAADEENRIIIHCMSDSRLCVFTDTGKVHVLKVEKVPHGKFRDKGTPIDNLCNYDSASETFLAIRDLEVVKNQKLIFVTKNGYIKMVEGTEFDVSKLTVAGTKLEENDRLLCVHEAHFQAGCVLVTKNSMVLRIQEDEIPLQKKNARGVIGIRLADGDEVIQVFFLEDGAQTEAEINGRNVSLNRLKVAARGGKGSKIRK